MSVVMILSAGEAQRLTQRIKQTANGVRDGLFRLRNLLDEAKASNAWQVLGFSSWTAYLADALGDEPMRVSREERVEIVGYLAGEGLSTRAIAPIVGVDNATVHRDISRVANATPAPTPPIERADVLGIVADPVTGEVVEPTVTEHTVTEKTKTVIGLDGKNYTRPESKPVARGDDAAQANAETESKALGRALITLSGMKYPEHRNRVITEWWPRGNDSVPPDSRALFEPKAIRDIATWLMQLADDLEVAP